MSSLFFKPTISIGLCLLFAGCNWFVSSPVTPSPSNLVAPDSFRRIMDPAKVRVTTVFRSASFELGMGGGAQVDHLFVGPDRLAISAQGAIYLTDNTSRLMKIDPAGKLHVLAGMAVKLDWTLPFVGGFADGLGSEGRFNGPFGLAVDASGTIFVADAGNHRIRKVTPEGYVSTVAGSGTKGAQDGMGLAAQFDLPSGIAVEASGSLIVTEAGGQRVRRITPEGLVTTLAGTGEAGLTDGPALQARFNKPYGVAVGPDGSIYVADNRNYRIRRILAGVVSTVAGSGTTLGYTDGPAASARLGRPSDVVCAKNGDLFVTDGWYDSVRRVTPSGEVTTLTGGGDSPMAAFQRGFEDGDGLTARFDVLSGLAINATGDLFVIDYGNDAIRKIEFVE